MVASNPDVIFYTIPTKTDQVVDISLVDSTQNIYKIYDEIRAALPDTLIVLVTPPPAEPKWLIGIHVPLIIGTIPIIWWKKIQLSPFHCMTCMQIS